MRTATVQGGHSDFDEKTRKAVFDGIDAALKAIWRVNKTIHEHPELGFEEVKAKEALVSILSELGFTITNPSSLPTAFVATYTRGSGGRTIGIDAEYDALPDVGHACGHNLIASVAVATAVGVKAALEARNVAGVIKLIGSPAEEGGGGKVILLREGVYDGLAACVMAHPEAAMATSKYDSAVFIGGPATLARDAFEVEFFGKGAHAGAAPWLGVNALDAAVQGYTAVSMMRQQLETTTRVHGIIQGSEKWAPNIIPAYSKVSYNVRAPDQPKVVTLKDKTLACFTNAAKSTGCTCKVHTKYSSNYKDLRNNDVLGNSYADFMTEAFGHYIELRGVTNASTDFGNVSHEMPAIHPQFVIKADGVNHTPEFTAGAGTQDSFNKAMDVAKGLAMVATKVVADDEYYDKVKASFLNLKGTL